MAAVYSANEGSLQSKNESLSSEYKEGGAQEVSIDPVSKYKAFNDENSGGELEMSPSGPVLKTQDHAEDVVTNAAVPRVNIKLEQGEEDECVAVHLVEVGEGDLDDKATSIGESSERDESADGDVPFQCEDCSEAFGDKEAFLEHRSEHIHDGPIVCLDTDSQWDDLLVSTDGGHKTLFCALCGEKFSSSKEFFAHQLKHRNQGIKQGINAGLGLGVVKQKLFECKDCGKAFASVGQCLNHQRSHKQASKSVFHQLAHLKKKSFQCPICGRSYSRASALDAHRRCHEVKLVKSKTCETEKSLTLNEAPGLTEDNGTSSEHTENHQQKIILCFCGKSYRSLAGLATHQRFSTSCSEGKVKEEIKHPFECTECGKTFVSSMALLCHQRWHKRRAQQVSNGQPYKCKECGKGFTLLTFYNKHQRLAHSEELAAKSFLNEVYQLKKKAFECQDCGRRFSRASALQSHQLCHTDIFRDIMEKDSKTSTATQTVKKYRNARDMDDDVAFVPTMFSQNIQVQERDFNCSDTHNTVEEPDVMDMDYEVIRITASDDYESSSSLPQDQNPDLELVCESDQEENDDLDNSLSLTAESTSSLQVNPEVDVKIVQIDYEHLNDERLINAKIMSKSHPEEPIKYNCPHCEQTFATALSLRHHMHWHREDMEKNLDERHKCQILTPTNKALIQCEVCGHESDSKSASYFHLQKHENKVPYKSISFQVANLQKNNIKCEECGMCFSRLSALHSHQQNHSKKPFVCLQCDRSYTTTRGLYYHRKCCNGSKLSFNNDKDEKAKHFNPTKSLLGPKVHHCKKCSKGFWSLGAYYHHKQNHSQCTNVEAAKPAAISNLEIVHVQRKKRGRRGGQKKEHPVFRTPSDSKKKHKCEVCGKSYHMLACFLKHQLSHDRQPPVKSFDHQVEQLKKNSYQCPDCGKVFSRAMALQFHMKSHGFETGLPVTESSNLPPSSQCRTCQADFTYESELRNHKKHCSKPKDNVKYTQKSEKMVIKEQDASSQDVEDVLVCDTSHSTHSTNEQKPCLDSGLKFKCQDCSRSFSVIGALNFHKRIHRIGYVSKKMLRAEQANRPKVVKMKPDKHLAKTPFMCKECGRYFSLNSALGTHMRWHRDKKFAKFLSKSYKKCSRTVRSVDGGPYLCNLCGKGFFYLCVLRRHQKRHPPMKNQLQKEEEAETAESDGNFTCPDCQMYFSSGSLLTTHFENHHSKQAKTEKPQSDILPTEESGPPIKQPYTPIMDITKQEKTNAQYHQCSHCAKRFLNVRGLRAHIWQKHLKVEGQPTASPEEHPNVVNCSACHKPFASEWAVQNHKRFCRANNRDLKPFMEEEPAQHSQNVELSAKCIFKCDKCAKAFPSEEKLNAHKEVAKTRPHCCALCCRGYWTESQLQQHLAWHDEVRRRLPTELRYRLNATMPPGPSDKLHALLQTSTSMVKQPVGLANPQPKSHICQRCEKTFLSQRALQQHQVVHQTEEPYHCSLSPQTNSDVRDLVDHPHEGLGDKEVEGSKLVSQGSGAENLTCIECGISFKQEMELHQHYIKHARGEF
ncbi:zinc finger protein 850-like [Myxocyprinus asiaticus]|uniref:zinc finger protein 850-like n=1 Tax=Myxocyprinus asiaticus TaxID=70543 RepID=UPI002221F457|nr:zinc finger protein 850-like [Myxocyprinus asiaticus]